MTYREVFSEAQPADPGEVFYTLTQADVGKIRIRTEIGVINLAETLVVVLRRDVGKRLYRVHAKDESHWIWQAESLSQHETRLTTPLETAAQRGVRNAAARRTGAGCE